MLDPFKFGAEGSRFSGRIPVKSLERLADQLFDRSGEIGFELDGEIGIEARPVLKLRVQGLLRLRCQRCLGGFDWKLNLASVLQFVPPGTPISDGELEEETYDVVEALPDLDMLTLVEDELLLAVPVAPRHNECEQGRAWAGEDESSPFAALAALRRRGEVQ